MENALDQITVNREPRTRRIAAELPIVVSWQDETSNETLTIKGVTESLAETIVLVHLEILPNVGTDVKLTLVNEKKTIIETHGSVIRVTRDPSRPLAALMIEGDLEEWKSRALTAAETWLEEKRRLDYDEDWAN